MTQTNRVIEIAESHPMPKVLYDIPGVKDSVQRPVVFDIIRQLMVWTGLPKDTNIQFAGETETVYQPGSTISPQAEFNSFNTDAQWTVSVDEQTQMDRVLSTAVLYYDNPHIFYDDKLTTYIRPAYSPVDVVIEFSARFQDKDLATRFRDNIRNRVSMMRDERVHSVSYSYLIPPECLHILKEIHRMREKVAPYNETYDTYYSEHVTHKATILTDFGGMNQVHAVAETQAKIIGWFEFEAEPEKGEKDAGSSAWDINFTYRFKYDRPTLCVMEYPLMVHNQMMSVKFRDTKPAYRLEDNLLNYSISSRLMASFEKTRIPATQGLPGVSIPDFDEFLPAQILPHTLRVITLLTSIDPAHIRELMPLTDLSDYNFTPEILAWLPSESQWLNKPNCSILNVSVYLGLDLLDYDQFEVTNALMVQMTVDPSLRDVFHVRISVHRNPKLLAFEAKERLRKNYTVAKQIFWSLAPQLKQMNLPGPALPGNLMTQSDFNKCINFIDQQYTMTNNGSNQIQFTVMTLLVEANRRD